MRAKYLFPLNVVTKEDLEKAGFTTFPDVKLYEIRPLPSENPILEEATDMSRTDLWHDGRGRPFQPTGKTVADLYREEAEEHFLD